MRKDARNGARTPPRIVTAAAAGVGPSLATQIRRARATAPRGSQGLTRGGDGGAHVPRRRGESWDANGLVVLTGRSIGAARARAVFFDSLVTTTDPADRAHRERVAADGAPAELDSSYRLKTIRELAASTPRGADLPGTQRAYHPSQVVRGRPCPAFPRGAPIGVDSMFDQWAQRVRRLDGIELGARCRFADGRGGGMSAAEDVARRLDAALPAGQRLRDRLHGRTRLAEATTDEDRRADALEARASAMLGGA